jgi:hypothetical protein
MGWAVATCLFWATVLTIFLPLMLTAMGTTVSLPYPPPSIPPKLTKNQGVFCFYAGTNIVAFVMIFLWVPETKQRTLEELDYIFAVPTRTHMRYQMTKALPYWINRWIFMKKDAVLEPLYTFDNNHTHEDRVNEMYENDRKRAERRAEGDVIQVERKGNGSDSDEKVTGNFEA